MMVRKKIQGFLHYRNDLGDGVRTGVVFSDCSEACDKICSSFSFLPEHDFCDDTPEKREYTSKELANYLKEEKVMYYAKELGVSFLGREPLRDPFFCAEVARELKEAGIRLQIHTCGMCSSVAFEYLDGLVDQYLLRVFLPQNLGSESQGARIRQVIAFLEEHKTPYRIQLFLSKASSCKEVESFAEEALRYRFLKSILLSFSDSEFSREDQSTFRQIFLQRKIPLY